jgi:hypothetical protein
MIAARIGCDHFLVWRMSEARAAALVPGLTPLMGDQGAWLLCAAAEFTAWRLFGLPGLGRLRTAAWLVPCTLDDGSIGNAFVQRFFDHALAPRGWAFAGWTQTAIRISTDRVTIGGQATACAGATVAASGLAWFDADRCGLLYGPRGWSRWPIAKRDWSWSFRQADMRSSVAMEWGAQPVGLITVRHTLARWGHPIVLPGMRTSA